MILKNMKGTHSGTEVHTLKGIPPSKQREEASIRRAPCNPLGRLRGRTFHLSFVCFVSNQEKFYIPKVFPHTLVNESVEN